MRRGWREVLTILTLAAAGSTCLSARGEAPAGPNTLTLEFSWSVPTAGASDQAPTLEPPRQDVLLEVLDGRIMEAVPWPWDVDPDDVDGSSPGPTEAGPWRLGSESTGRVRCRLEAGPAGTLLIHRGEQAVRLPVAAVVDRPQSLLLQSGLSLNVQRLPWDVLDVDLGAGVEDGIAAPGAPIPVTIGYNILQQDAAELTLRTTAVLRGVGQQEPIWQYEQREVLPANRPTPPARLWTVPAPEKEGTYVLEIQAAWEASGVREGSRIGRLIRRRKAPAGTSTASRRVVLAVLGPNSNESPPILADAEFPPKETEVDSFDLSRVRTSRFVTSGRSPVKSGGSAWAIPAELLAEEGRGEKDREWLRNLISKAGPEPARIGPADESGLAWSAVALRVAHPEKPHRLSLTVSSGDASALGAVVLDGGRGEARPRIQLDACGSRSPAGSKTLEWVLWPGSTEPLLILVNRHASSEVLVGGVKIAELEPEKPALDRPEPSSEGRNVGLYLTGPDALSRFASSAAPGIENALATGRNLASYLATCGASFVVLPEGLEERERRRRLGRMLTEDATGPDRLAMVRRILARQGIPTWVEVDLERERALPGLPPAGSDEAIALGLARIDPAGGSDGGAYQLLHPRVREAITARVASAVTEGPGHAGVLLRLGRGPTLLGTPDTGMDDDTFSRFVQETFAPEAAKQVPGLGTTDPGRFAARARYFAGVGRMPWLTWRSRAVAGIYSELGEAVKKASPNAVLALATPTLDDGAAGKEARRVDLAGLAPSQAWRSVGLDLENWKPGPGTPVLLRGSELAVDDLSRDLAWHPDLDATLSPFHRRGFLLNVAGGQGRTGRGPGPEATALPLGDDGSAAGPLAHAVSSIDAQCIVLADRAVAGREEAIRRFSEVFRSLPSEPRPVVPPIAASRDSGVVIRKLADGGRTLLAIANDTPFAMRMSGVIGGDSSAAVEDLGRRLKLAPEPVDGGRRLVLDLPPYGLSVVRVDAPSVPVENAALYPSEAVQAGMESRSKELAVQLASLNRGLATPLAGPPNAGFEQEPATPAAEGGAIEVPGGWKVDGGDPTGTALTLDASRPYEGARSLRMTSSGRPISLVSAAFAPGAGTSLLVQTYLRGDSDRNVVRLWIEGEREGRSFARRSEAVVAKEWTRFVVRAADLPPGGLDAVRLRFEFATPGNLWIDDVRVLAEVAPKAVRLNAQRTLLAALQAYREKRYAEFARLADSHWAKHPGILALVRGDRDAELTEVRKRAPEAPPAASALPPNRTLR